MKSRRTEVRVKGLVELENGVEEVVQVVGQGDEIITKAYISTPPANTPAFNSLRRKMKSGTDICRGNKIFCKRWFTSTETTSMAVNNSEGDPLSERALTEIFRQYVLGAVAPFIQTNENLYGRKISVGIPLACGVTYTRQWKIHSDGDHPLV